MTDSGALTRLSISGFADEIDASFDRQLDVVSRLGMRSICLRAADGRGIADYSVEEAAQQLLPRLRAAGIGVSALGSPIGKVDIADDVAVEAQFARLDELCRIAAVLGARAIRVFSFYVPSPEVADNLADRVLDRMIEMAAIAARHQTLLVLENEKHTFGDIGRRCKHVLDSVDSPYLASAFDFANFVQCDDDPVACWGLIADRVADIHIKDARYGDGRNVLCATGDGRIAELLGKAIAHGYGGPLTLEPHLATFATFAKLERDRGHDTIGQDGYENGAAAYEAQLDALLAIVDTIPNAAHDVTRPDSKRTIA